MIGEIIFVCSFWITVLAVIEANRVYKKLKPIQEICKKYSIPLDDLPEVLEEYIDYDNEEYLEKLRKSKN